MNELNLNPSESWMITAREESTFELFERSQVMREKTLNLISYIPWFSSLGGVARMCMGTVQLVQFTVAAIFATLSDVFAKQPNGYHYRPAKHIFYAFHSAGNIIRGLIEFVPGVLINLLFLTYDQLFNARIKHAIEHKPGYTDPYLRAWQWIKSPQPLALTPPTAGSSKLTRRTQVSSLP